MRLVQVADLDVSDCREPNLLRRRPWAIAACETDQMANVFEAAARRLRQRAGEGFRTAFLDVDTAPWILLEREIAENDLARIEPNERSDVGGRCDECGVWSYPAVDTDPPRN